ncbi:MAG: tyrosine-protein phosphatase [Gemmatimonadaceae bacterium]
MLDFHNHLMPGVDDGAANISESRKGLETLRSQGVIEVITTPHFQASSAARPRELLLHLAELDDSWEKLNALAVAEFPSMRVERGVEVALDIPHPRLDDERLRLAGTSYALVEFPYMSIPPNSTLAVRELVRSGVTPIIAHPERYAGMAANPDILESWRDSGARIQVNSGSLLGYYGANPKRLAWEILAQGMADYLSSDYHSRGKCPVAECASIMKEKGGEAQHRLLTTTNSRRILLDQQPLPVPPLHATVPSIWKRVMPWR